MRKRRLSESDLQALSRPPVKRAVRHKSQQGQRAAQRPRSPSETAECRTFIAWTKLVTFMGEPLDQRVVKIANERGKAGVATAILASIGMREGFPDYVIHVPVIATFTSCATKHGLYLEAKRVSGGKIDPEQERWRDRLIAWGYHAEICEGALQMIDAVKRYMRMTGATQAGLFVDNTRVAA